MFLSADTMAYLFGLGLDNEQLVELVRRLDADAQATAPVRSSAAERQARYRQRRNERDVTRDVTPPPSKEVSPEPLQETQPLSPPSPPKGGSSPRLQKPNGFSRFWEAYPLKVGKRAAELAYERALKRITGPDPPAEIMAGLTRAKSSPKWTREPDFIPHPTTWLNQDRWLDGMTIPTETTETPQERQDREARQAQMRAWAEKFGEEQIAKGNYA